MFFILMSTKNRRRVGKESSEVNKNIECIRTRLGEFIKRVGIHRESSQNTFIVRELGKVYDAN